MSTRPCYPIRQRASILNKYQCVKKPERNKNTSHNLQLSKNCLEPVIHISTYKSSNTNEIICVQCGKTLQTENAIKAKFKPVQKRLFYCHACSKVFPRFTTFLAHRKKHLSFRCPLCGLKKRTNDGVLRHLFTHFNLKPYSCSKCKKGYSSLISKISI